MINRIGFFLLISGLSFAEPNLIEQTEQEHKKLKAELETQFGKPLADTQNEYAIALEDLKRFETIKAMDPDVWSGHLSFAQNKLLKPESLSAKELIGLQKMVDTLTAAPPHFLTREQASESDQYEFKLNQRVEQTKRQLQEQNCSSEFIIKSTTLSEVEDRLSILRSQKEALAILTDKAQRNRTTIGYQDRVQKLKDLNVKTCTLAQEHKKLAMEREIAQLETNQISLKDAMEIKAAELKAFHDQFKKALHDLETWDLNAKIARKGEDPYLKVDSLKTPAELVREYQLARQGVSNMREAYKKLLSRENFDLLKLWESINLETLKNLLLEAKDLARDYPLECADLTANLAHTYSILTMNGGMTDEIKTILDRRTAENLVTDAILGQQSALYSTGELKEISLKPLALIDFCNRAPYIAGALMQEHMTGAKTAKAAAAWIPGLGNWTPVQYAAGVAGALAEVKAQKEASKRISRQYEIMANSVLVALRDYQHGGYTGALKEAAAYAATRQMIQSTGNIFRTALEGRAIDELLTGWREAPTTEALKASTAWGTGLLAGSSALGSAVASAGGAITIGTLVWPALITTGIGLTVRVAANAVHEHFKSPETKLSEKQQQNACRLQIAYKRLQVERTNLPDLTEADFKQAATTDKPEDKMVLIIDTELKKEQDKKYHDIAIKAQVDPKMISVILQGLVAVIKPMTLNKKLISVGKQAHMAPAEG